MNFINELDTLRSNKPIVPVNPRTIAYIPNCIVPIFEIMNGVRKRGKINPITWDMK
jgi:hypothetical protein